MENCPFCDAPGSYRETRDGSCYVCGMMLPNLSGSFEPEAVATMVEEKEIVLDRDDDKNSFSRDEPTIFVETPSAPTVFSQSTEPPAIELIHPRNLSPEYARRVTAAWQVTKSPFKSPLETINARTSATDESSNLLIGSRSVGQAGEGEKPDFVLNEVIGEGNMGTVWSAKQSSLAREVALKMPKPYASSSAFGRQLFMSEVVVTGQLDHPNIVPIYDLARDQSGQLFYAMKRVEGRSWDRCMSEAGRTRHDNVEILMKVCDAIRFAHDRKVIHRDIKPQNVMVGKYGEVSVMDWGIALRLPEGTHIPGMAKVSPSGTPAYMAPEMATGNANEIGPHTDVYLLGAVLYEIITGEPPHPAPKQTGDTLVQQKACLLIAARNVITPAKESGELVDIAYKAMATDIYDRFASVDEFQTAIRSYFEHAESIALTDRGDQHLTNARELRNGVYEDYAKARFAFDEAIQLWPENHRARIGLSHATTDYAGSALERGDYALGLSLVDGSNPSQADLAKKLRAAKRRHDRNRFVAVASAVAAACTLVLGIAAVSVFALRESAAKRTAKAAEVSERQQRIEADKAKDEAKASEKAAIEAKDKEKEQRIVAETEKEKANKLAKSEADARKIAVDEGNKAKAAQAVAEDQTKLAKVATAREVEAKKDVQKASYRSEIGLAAEEVRRNAFTSAQAILSSQARNETQAPLCNWEWGHLMYLAREPSIARFEVGGSSRIEAVALSSDQKWLAASTDDGQLHVWWRPNPNQPAQKLPTPAGKYSQPITSLAISKDNQLLIVASGKKVNFWQLPNGEVGRGLTATGTPIEYSSLIRSVALSPKGDTLLTCADDSRAQLWSRANPSQPWHARPLVGHLEGGPVWQAAFSPDGQLVATAGDDESVRIWDANTDKEIRVLREHRGPVYAVAFSPDGKYVVSGGRDRRLLAWDLTSPGSSKSKADAVRDSLRTIEQQEQIKNALPLGEHRAEIHCIAFSPDGKTLFSGSDDNSLGVWDLSHGIANTKLTKSLRGHGGWVRSCAVAQDGTHVLSGSYDGRAFLWDWKQYAFPRVLRPESRTDVRFTAAAASPGARWIASATEDGIVTMWDMRDPLNPTPQTLNEGHDWQATTGVYFGDGKRLLTAGGDNSALIWDTHSGNQLLRIGGWNVENGTGWRGVGAASHNGQLIATGSNDSSVLAKVWDSTKGRLVASLSVGSDDWPEQPANVGNGDPAEAAAVAFAPDDKSLFVGDQRGRGYVFRTTDGSLIGKFVAHEGKINAAAFLPNGRLLTASNDKSVVKWRLSLDQTPPQKELTLTHGDRVVALGVSKDNKLLITASDSGDEEAVVRIWNVENGAPLPKLALADLVGRERATAKTSDREQNGTNSRPAVRYVALNPDQSQSLITLYDPASLTYTLGAWDYANGPTRIRWLKAGLHDTSMAIYSPDHDGSILTVGGRGAQVRLANQVVMSYRPQTRVQSISFSPSGKLLAAAGGDGSIKLWRFQDATQGWMPERKLLGHHGQVNSVAFHPQHDEMLLSGGQDGAIQLWRQTGADWKANRFQADRAHGEPVQQAIFSPADERGDVEIYSAADSRIDVWNTEGKLLSSVSLDRPVHCLAVSADRHWLVAGVGNEAWVWNRSALGREPVQKLPGHSAEISAIAFSQDNQRLFTAGRDFHVKLWDAGAWNSTDPKQPIARELLTLEEHKGGVVSLAYIPSATNPALLTAGADGQTILWPTVDWRKRQ